MNASISNLISILYSIQWFKEKKLGKKEPDSQNEPIKTLPTDMFLWSMLLSMTIEDILLYVAQSRNVYGKES